jgi:hypothetical protein
VRVATFSSESAEVWRPRGTARRSSIYAVPKTTVFRLSPPAKFDPLTELRRNARYLPPVPRCPRSPKRWEGGSVGLRQSRGRRALRVWRIPRASVYRSRKEDAAEYDRLLARSAHVRVRPVSAVHVTASMPSPDQVPVKSTHSTMRWPRWVVLIAGSTGSALRVFAFSAQ